MSDTKQPAEPRDPDFLLLAAVAALVGIGIVMVYSSSAVFSARVHGSSSHLLVAQLWRVGFGGIAFAIGYYLPRTLLRRIAPWLFAVSCVLCLITLFPGVGHEAGGARRWLRFGSFTLQPSEFAKIGLMLTLASFLARREEQGMLGQKLFGPLLLMQIPVLLIAAEPDFGTALVAEAIALTMVFVGGLRLRYVIALTLAGLPVIYSMLMESYRLKRIIAWLDPLEHRSSIGYQLTEALISIGVGGRFGVGLGQSRQKLFFLPEAHTDFVFAIYAEELGFVGVVALLFLFGTVIVRGSRIVAEAGEAYERYLAAGIVALVAIPTAFNLWVVTGLLPTKGLPLPLLSYGGSNVVATLGALGVLVGISRRQPSAEDT